MKPTKYTIGKSTFGFSIDGIRKRYSKKEDFVSDMTKAYPEINKKDLSKVLNRVWEEAFPQKESKEKGAE